MELLTPALRSSDLVVGGLGDRQLRRLAARGDFVRIVAGAYVESSTWRRLSDRQRHVAVVRAAVERIARPVAISHWSAAAVQGLPHADGWPRRVTVTDPQLSKTTTTRAVLRRSGRLSGSDVEDWQGLWVTTAARTAADLALTEPFENAVVVIDHGLRARMFTRDDVREQLLRRGDARRLPSALRAVDFADDRAEYAGESFSRVNAAARGFEAPTLQVPFRDGRGLIGIADFWWESVGVVGEFDGDWKYTDSRWLRGRTVTEAILDEKRRHARLEAHPCVERVVRWDYAVARDADELARRLLAAGVPRISATNRTPRRA